MQAPLTALEIEVSDDGPGGATDDLLVVDGPLRNRRQLPRTIGYVKTQQKQYLPAALTAGGRRRCGPGQRTPVFRLGTRVGRLLLVPAAARRRPARRGPASCGWSARPS